MNFTVNLNREQLLVTIEIKNELAKRMLSSELKAKKSPCA